MESKLKTLSRGRTGKLVIEVLEEVIRDVADVRTSLKVKPELENQVRLGIIEILEERLVDKLKVLTGKITPPEINEFI